MKVCWTETAVEQLSAIHAYISLDSATYAQRVVDRPTRKSEQIAEHPLRAKGAGSGDGTDPRGHRRALSNHLSHQSGTDRRDRRAAWGAADSVERRVGSECGPKLEQVRMPRNGYELRGGESTCTRCGCASDKWGRPRLRASLALTSRPIVCGFGAIVGVVRGIWC